MVKFKYIARESPEKVVNGVIEADRIDIAVSKIISLGLTPVEVNPIKESLGLPLQKKTRKTLPQIQVSSRKGLMVFTRQLSDLVGASVPILKALKLIVKQTRDMKFKEVVQSVTRSVEDGTALSSALTNYPYLFNSFYCNMVKTGEHTGRLDVILERLAQNIEDELKIKSSCIKVLSYPLFVLAAGIFTVFVIFTFVLPNMISIFEDMDQVLPLSTVILIALNHLATRFGWLLVILVCVLIGIIKRRLDTPAGKRQWHTFLLRTRFIGTLVQQLELGRLTRTWGLLVESGVDMSSGMQSIIQTIDNVLVKEELTIAAQKVQGGASLKTALQPCSVFDEFAINMISVGEETGQLARGLYKTSSWYERQSMDTIQQMISLLGPFVLIIVVFFVGFIAVAILSPLMNMNMGL
ncbi:MAG: type II secretion system F family protein [Candidatus Omnitrophica bacterium]|nr:type II secretion system F family protein [Candidatus Omnitrophota bacterium]